MEAENVNNIQDLIWDDDAFPALELFNNDLENIREESMRGEFLLNLPDCKLIVWIDEATLTGETRSKALFPRQYFVMLEFESQIHKCTINTTEKETGTSEPRKKQEFIWHMHEYFGGSTLRISLYSKQFCGKSQIVSKDVTLTSLFNLQEKKLQQMKDKIEVIPFESLKGY